MVAAMTTVVASVVAAILKSGVVVVDGDGAGAGIGAGAVASESRSAIGSVVFWVEIVVSRARTARLRVSAVSFIDSTTGIPVLPCRFHIFLRTSSISSRL